jgi:hypothetical protein
MWWSWRGKGSNVAPQRNSSSGELAVKSVVVRVPMLPGEEQVSPPECLSKQSTDPVADLLLDLQGLPSVILCHQLGGSESTEPRPS